MIGDWVIRRGVPEEPMWLSDMKTIAGIAYLDQDGRGVAEKFENIEPIPLSEEILNLKKQLRDANVNAEIAKASTSNSGTINNLDILKRISNLEKIIYGNKENDE